MKINAIKMRSLFDTSKRLKWAWTTLITFVLLFSSSFFAQESSVPGASTSPNKRGTANRPEKNVQGLSRVNPYTHALEFNLPIATYPGRGGNSLPIEFRYSSNVWRQDTAHTWWRWREDSNHTREYITDLNALYAEHSAAGWTSSLLPPRLEEDKPVYNANGNIYRDSVREEGEHGLIAWWQWALWQMASPLPTPARPSGGIEDCGLVCTHTVGVCYNGDCDSGCASYTPYRCMDTRFDEPDPTVVTPFENELYYVPRLRVIMPDGSSHEFRKSDLFIPCGRMGPQGYPCNPNYLGTFLAVDGSGMTLDVGSDVTTLNMPNGSRYIFSGSASSVGGNFANSFIDVNGNTMSFTESLESWGMDGKWTDTVGRQITDPIPHNWKTQAQQAGTPKAFNIPGIENGQQHYELTWKNLKPLGCEDEENNPNCQGYDQTTGGALDNQNLKLFYPNQYLCKGNENDDLYAVSNGEVLFHAQADGTRLCTPVDIQRGPDGSPTLTPSPNPQGTPILIPVPIPVRFNPVVLNQIKLPNGQHYEFLYNQYGEMSKITYPSGSYETFEYGGVVPFTGSATTPDVAPYLETNRGVKVRRIFDENGVLQQKWIYTSELVDLYSPTSPIKVTAKSSKPSDPNEWGASTTTILFRDSQDPFFGYSDLRAGRPIEEKSYDENGNLRSRVLTEYTMKGGFSWSGVVIAERDVRVKRAVSINFEPGSSFALATMSETSYDENGSADSSDFSHLNVKSQKNYHYATIPADTVDDEVLSWATVASWFPANKLASVTENVYQYNPDYKARGITSLPVETRVMDPAHPADVSKALAKTQTVYDEYELIGDPTTPNFTAPDSPLRGNPTTTKTFPKGSSTSLDAHAQYDVFGNIRKVWDVSGDATKFTETEYSPTYQFAYPTKVIAPAPNAGSSNHGTNETSTVETAYDFNTGLPLAFKDDFGQITTTEYDDPLLRQTRVRMVDANGATMGPIAETEYKDNEQRVIVRKQLDATNWDSAMSFMDSFGRVIKTVAKDSQGDVIVETKYDLLGRVTMVSNPYRAGDTIYWNKTRYDEAGRAVETYAPALLSVVTAPSPYPSDLFSLGKTEYDISSEAGFVGTVVTTTDASGRKGRSVTNALGQLLRVDEPDSEGNLPALPQSTGNPQPSPTEGGGGCVDNCFTGSGESYPSHSTFYKYDAYGKMVQVTQGGQERFFKYDSLGRLIRVRQPEQEVNASLNLNDPTTDNNQWTAGFTYDVLGNVLTATDANGTVITNTYDRAGRVLTRTYNDAATSGLVGTTPSVNFFYDGKGLDQQQSPNYAKGKLTKVSNSVSTTLYSQFDNFGRVTESKQITDGQTYASSYVYNLSGALVQETYPSGRVVKNEFESDGDLAKVSSKKNLGGVFTPFVSNFSYTAAGGITQMKLGNGKFETAKFNSRLQVIELGLGASAADAGLWKTIYEYGELDENGEVLPATNTGNIARQTLSIGELSFVQSYRYDSLYRLTSAKETSGETETWAHKFSYDRFGNRTFFEELINGIRSARTAPSVNADTNRFSAQQGFTYDKNGNVVQDSDAVTSQNRTFVFNADNKQAEIRNANGIAIGKYYYDGEGKRVKKITDTETTVFVYSSGKLVAEYSTALPSASPEISYTTTDHLGSPRIVTNQLGNVTSRRDFMPFGEDVPTEAGDRANIEDQLEVGTVEIGTGNLRTTALNYTSTDGIRQRFTGYQKDTETSLDFAEARMYESRYGRFTAVDPLLASGKSANPQTFNRYVYVLNSPLNLTDPTGLDPWWRKAILGEDGKPTGRFHYKEAKKNPGDWDEVKFDASGSVAIPEWGKPGGPTAYLYAGGGQDFGARNSQWIQNTIFGGPAGLPPCPTSICGSATPNLPSLDMSRNQPLRSVEGIARLAEAGSLIPGVGAPFAVVAAAVRAGQGNAVDAGTNLAMGVPFFGITKFGKVTNVADGATLGLSYTKSNLKLGQEMHKAYKAGLADKINTFKEFRLPSGKRIDFLDKTNGIIFELKPFNPRGFREGQKQLNRYKSELEQIPDFKGINWRTVLDTY